VCSAFVVTVTMWSVIALGGCAWFASSKNGPVVETREPKPTVPLPKAAVKASVDSTPQKGGAGDEAGEPGRKGEQTTKSAAAAGKEPRFPKHDHQRYNDEIKKKAAEVMNQQEKSADLVTLCQDNLTDQWWMTAYKKGNKSYSYVVYSWDPIDGSFKQTMDSGKGPTANWKHHVNYSRSGKTCSILKGSEE